MTSASFLRLASTTASTKRSTYASGKYGTPAAHLSGLDCTPLDPVDPEVKINLGIEAPVEILETYVVGSQDIVETDRFVVGSDEYLIRAIEKWDFERETFMHLFLEESK